MWGPILILFFLICWGFRFVRGLRFVGWRWLVTGFGFVFWFRLILGPGPRFRFILWFWLVRWSPRFVGRFRLGLILGLGLVFGFGLIFRLGFIFRFGFV